MCADRDTSGTGADKTDRHAGDGVVDEKAGESDAQSEVEGGVVADAASQVRRPPTLLRARALRALGANMHYITTAAASPGVATDNIVFLHGIPTSSYLWRHIMPGLAGYAQCWAPDLVGMGQSDHPEIDYHVVDHVKYFSAWMDVLDLSDVILVLHGWGSVIGLSYWLQHPKRVKGIVLFESHLRPFLDWDSLSLPMQMRGFLLKDPEKQYDLIVKNNYFVNHFLRKATLVDIPDTVFQHYAAPFKEEQHRRVLWQYFRDFPLHRTGYAPVTQQLITEYAGALQSSPVPKLLLYAMPGFLTTLETLMWCRTHWPSTSVKELGQGLHFGQESLPKSFSSTLLDWYQRTYQ